MTETANTIMQFVQGVGFPIACAVCMFYLLYRQMEDRRTEAEQRAKRDGEFSRLLAENTSAINTLRDLVTRLHGGDVNGR